MSKDYSQLGSPSYEGMREFVVTLNNFDDSQSFYNDMETEGGDITIPNRQCDCYKRRPASRNTHYMLTYDEARTVLDDDRVKHVSLTEVEKGLKRVPVSWNQTSTNFDKDATSDVDDINWGLVRSLVDTNLTGWGDGAALAVSKSIYSEYSGKNVDVVVMDDGAPYPSTYEFAKNPDGTGFTRMVQYNWYKHNPEVSGEAAGDYDYRVSGDKGMGVGSRAQFHGAHCTGTAAGNTQGWARDADIYSLSYNDDPMYVKEFHLNKPINPVTGIRNPTVMNNSWGYRAQTFNAGRVSEISHRGTIYSPQGGDATTGSATWDSNVLETVYPQTGQVPTQDVALMADFEDLVEAGIVVIVSAGNSTAYQDVPTGPDYDNYYKEYINGVEETRYYHRGSTPGNSPGVITVGACGATNNNDIVQDDYRADFSNFGPGVDIFAAGENIQSCSTIAWANASAAVDPRVAANGGSDTENNNFIKIGGTSMSGPQVCGVFACLAQKYPRMTSADALNYIKTYCPETVDYTTGGYLDDYDIGYARNTDSSRRYLFLKQDRIENAVVSPGASPIFKPLSGGSNSLYRQTTGMTFPQKNLRITDNTEATFSLETDNSTLLLGDTATVTLTTTNVPDGTEVPYLITSGYKRSGLSVTVTTGYNVVSDKTNTYVATLYNDTGAEFATTASPQRHVIDMSAAATPTFELDPVGYNAFVAPNENTATYLITVGNSASTAYTLTGNDRDGKEFINASNRSITINAGDTLNLERTSGGHPLYIKDALGTGTTGRLFNSDGVTGSGANAIGETVSWTPTNAQTGIYYYQCSAHPDMNGYIFVQPQGDPFELTTSHPDWTTGESNYADDGEWEIDIPWNVSIFGTNRSKLWVSSNSHITFDARYGYFDMDLKTERDRIMYMSGDGSTPNGLIKKKIYGTAPNRYLYIGFEGKEQYNGGGNDIQWDLWMYENDASKIYMQAVKNGRYGNSTDYYPFYQDEILGGTDTVGTMTVNNNTASLTIQPSFIPSVGGGGVNVNVRLGFYGTPDLDILCQD